MVRTKKTKTFTASTESEARKHLARWKLDHPDAIITEGRPIRGTPVKPIARHQSKEPATTVTIPIAYEE